jgi:hypothetical protein
MRDELKENILTEFKQVLKLAPTDYTENCTNVVMSMVDTYTEKECNLARKKYPKPKFSIGDEVIIIDCGNAPLATQGTKQPICEVFSRSEPSYLIGDYCFSESQLKDTSNELKKGIKVV